MSAEPQLIGLDVGTTSCKAGLFDARGRLLAQSSAPYPLARPRPGHVEQDPERYWTAAAECLRTLLASPAADIRRLAALSACGQAPTLVLLDRDGRPVRPAILWQDTRASAEAAALARDPGIDVLARLLDVRWPVDASLPLARFRWLRRHEPETLARATMTMLPKDLVHARLTGTFATDPWSAKGLVHQGTRRPVAGLESLCGVSAGIVPPAAVPRDIIGRVTPEGAAATGLPVGLPVAAGWTDAMAAMLGTGAFGTSGIGCDVSGTSEVVGLTLPARPHDPGALLAGPIVDTGRWVLYGPTQASGASLGWALRTLASPRAKVPSHASEAQSRSSADSGLGTPDPSDALGAGFGLEDAFATAAEAPAGADGLVFLPYLEGERAPLWDPRARGALVGLTTGHGPAHVYRAVLEGVACSLWHILGMAEQIGGEPVEEVRVAGGGARHRSWNQIKADVTGRPFRPCAVTENGALGAAMLAALGAGLYQDVAEASHAMVQLEDVLPPNPDNRAVYERTFERYVALYPRIGDLFS
ncbi:MAG: hypothetical protein HY332_12205 [Chloroflexi bacterium]|nr:hypothetical protein [Chloroflexota bacterium]